ERKRRISGQQPGTMITREQQRTVRLRDGESVLAITREGDRLLVRFEGGNKKSHVLASAWRPGDPVWSGPLDGRQIWVQVRAALNAFHFSRRGLETRAYVYTERESAAARLMPIKQVADSGKA